MSDRTNIRRKKADTTIANPSLVSSSTPTLANSNHSLALQSNNTLPEISVQALSNQQDTQSNNEQLPEREAFKQEPLGHDISRISLRPQSKLSTGQSSDPSEPEANWVADRIMRMPEPGNFADQMPETRFRGHDLSQPSSVSQSQGHDLRKISMLPVRAKLTVSQSGDPYEQEADWVANEVMRMQIPESNEAVAMRSLRDTIYRKCAVCEDEDLVQPKSMLQRSPDTGFQVASNLESRLSSSQGGGSPLPEEVRSFMEPRFGADFSQVRVHTGSEAVQMNRDLNAQAFTHKQDVYFGAGKAPGKDALTAHELTHVVQQTGAVQTKEALNQQNVQLKCAACEEEANVQRSLDISSVSEMGVQRSWFGDDDEKKEPESSSGGGVLDWAKDKVGGAVDSVSQAGGAAVDWAKEKGSSAVDTVTQAGGDAYDWVKQKGGAAVDTVTQAGGDAYDWAKQKGGEAVDTVTQAGSDAYDWAKQKGGEAVDVATDVGGQALDLMSNLGNVQVDWNSASGKILKAWASQLDPELVQNIRGKNPSDLYNLVDVPAQVQQAAEDLAKQASMNTAPSAAPMNSTSGSIQMQAAEPLLDPGIPPSVDPGIPPSGVRQIPGARPSPGPGIGIGIGAAFIAFMVFLAIMLWSRKTAPRWMDEINPETGKPYSSQEEYDQVNKRLKDKRQEEEEKKKAEEPVMPEGLSRQKKEKWKKCKEMHEIYKNTQDKVGSLGTEIKDLKIKFENNVPLDSWEKQLLCAKVNQQLDLLQQLINERQEYIKSECDEFDWFKKGNTEEERKSAHQGEVDNVRAQEGNLRGLLKKLRNAGIC